MCPYYSSELHCTCETAADPPVLLGGAGGALIDLSLPAGEVPCAIKICVCMRANNCL